MSTADTNSLSYRTLMAAIEARVPSREVERLYMLMILESQQGNKCRTAKILKIDRRTIQRTFKRDADGSSNPTYTAPAKLVEAPCTSH